MMNDDPIVKSAAPKLSIAVLLTGTLFVAIVLASWNAFGNPGIAPALAFVALAWFALSRTRTPAFHVFNRQRMTVVELLTITTICLILHGLTIPAVRTGPHHRRPFGAPAASPVTRPSGSSTTSNDQPEPTVGSVSELTHLAPSR